MRRDQKPPPIKWRHVWIFLAGAVLLITFGADRCSSAAKKDRYLIKGSLVLNINNATAEELQTLPDVGPARARALFRIDHTSPWTGSSKNGYCQKPLLTQIALY